MMQPTHFPTPQPADAPLEVGQDVCGVGDATLAAADFVQAQQAIGATFGESLGVAAVTFGMEACRPIFRESTMGRPSPEILQVLQGVAKTTPETANTFLCDALSSGAMTAWLDNETPGLWLARQAWITSLPANLEVGGYLDLKGASLAELPPGLKTRGSLELTGCANIVTLPADLVVGDDLFLHECASLTHLPAGVQVGDRLAIRHCPLLAALPEGLRVGRGIYVHACPSLAALPPHLRVWGFLSLRECPALTSLPPDLSVQQSLTIQQCEAWDGILPDDLHVGLHVKIDDEHEVPLDQWRIAAQAKAEDVQGGRS